MVFHRPHLREDSHFPFCHSQGPKRIREWSNTRNPCIGRVLSGREEKRIFDGAKEGLISKELKFALAGVAQLVGCHPARQRVADSIPGQDTGLGCWFCPRLGSGLQATD